MPWRVRRTPYRVFISEIMLQQTSVSMVRSRYLRFLTRFPSFRRLAGATVGEVVSAWKGLGYNRRALALRQSARLVVSRFSGRLPRTMDELTRLPGVGPATAGAILVYAFDLPQAFVETNVRRVFLHFFFPNGRAVPDSLILPLVEQTMDRENPREWFYALMDYGAFLGARARSRSARAGREVHSDPVHRSNRYRRQGAFEGSLRQLRGRLLEALLRRPGCTPRQVAAEVGGDPRASAVLHQLEEEGFLRLRAGRYSLR